MSAPDPFSAGSLSQLIAAFLPRDASSSSGGQVPNATAAVTIASHAAMTAAGFRLRDFDELPSDWTTFSRFAYTHHASNQNILLSVSSSGTQTTISAEDQDSASDARKASFSITTADFVDAAQLPASPTGPATSAEDAAHSVQKIFISPSKLAQLAGQVRGSIVDKLAPLDSSSSSSSAQSRLHEAEHSLRDDSAHHPLPRHDPLRDEPQLPRPAVPRIDDPLRDPTVGPGRGVRVPPGDFAPPGFEDEYEMNRPPRGQGSGVFNPAGGRQPGVPRIGDRDLYPPGLGPDDPLRIGPGGGGGGGMHPTFDDLTGRRGGQFGDGDDMQAPFGARFDPPGPGMGPPRGSGGHFGGGGGGGFFGGGAGGGII